MNDHDYVGEIRSKVDIVDVISSYLPLTQKGKNFFGICPFHDDNNPSMSVSRDLQIFRCFSCGASGNVFKFVMDYEHISFKETLVLLARKAGVELKGLSVKEKTNHFESFYTIYELANKFYQNNLNSNQGKMAREYLKSRSIADDIVKEFEIGLSLTSHNQLVELMQAKGYDLKTLNHIGLASEDHDTYINRIMFPLHDLQGKVIGFSGRIYDNSKLNKYLNTKETPIFKKGQLIYHYHIAREEVRVKKQVIIMEGFMDVIRASVIGFKNTVALMGTAMTKEQATLIKRLTPNIVLCFDGDEPGRHATLVNGEYFLTLGISPKVVSIPEELDPDTFILKYGEERFRGLIENAIPFSDYKIKVLKESVNPNSEESVADYINSVIVEVSKLHDEIRSEIILKGLAKEFNIEYNTLDQRLASIKVKEEELRPTIIIDRPSTPPKKRKDKYALAVLAILYYMLFYDKVIRKYEKEGIYFPEEKQRVLASEISYYYKKYGIIKVADFYTYLDGQEELVNLLTEVLSLELSEQIELDQLEDFFKVAKEYNVNQEVKRLQKMIKEEIDPLEKAKIAERIRVLRIGS